MEKAMTSDGWKRRLASTGSAHDVVKVVNEYMALCGPDQLEELPEQFRVQSFEAAEEIVEFAFVLTRHQLDAKLGIQVAETTIFLASASQRLAEIAAVAFSERALGILGTRTQGA